MAQFDDPATFYEESGNFERALELTPKQDSDAVVRLDDKLLRLGKKERLFDAQGRPRIKLLELLKLLGMPEQFNSCEQINQWAQAHLLRHGERWDQQQDFEFLRFELAPLLAELGFLDAPAPHFDTYQGALVYGALLLSIRRSIHYLVEQWKQGVRFSQLYFLCGERTLREVENIQQLYLEGEQLSPVKKGPPLSAFPTTECEVARLIWEMTEVPEEMRDLPVSFVNGAKQPDSARATRNETVKAWLELAPEEGTYLAIAHAPYHHRQDLVVRELAPTYQFETVGYKASENMELALILDEVARAIFQINQMNHSKPF